MLSKRNIARCCPSTTMRVSAWEAPTICMLAGSRSASNWSVSTTLNAVSFPVFWNRIVYSNHSVSMSTAPAAPNPCGVTSLSFGSKAQVTRPPMALATGSARSGELTTADRVEEEPTGPTCTPR